MKHAQLKQRSASAPTPKLGLPQHTQPSQHFLGNGCGSSIATNAKGNGMLCLTSCKFHRLLLQLPPTSQVWQQQRSGRSYTALCVDFWMQGTSHSIALGNRSAREGVTVVTEEESPTSGL